MDQTRTGRPEERPDNHVHHDVTDSVRQDVEVAWELGYETGYQHALILAAERVDLLDAIWRPVPRSAYEEKVAERIADMEAAFRRTFPGREPYRGGPVPVWGAR